MPRILTVAALGDVVRVDLSRLTDDDARAVEAVWRDALAEPGAPEPACPADPAIAGPPTVTPLGEVSREAMLSDLSQRVTLAAIQRARGRLWMLHAAGLALDDGRVVVLIGPSGRGKTTASRTLGRHYGYVSDETIAVGPGGGILPYRKPLSIIERTPAPKTQVAPSALSLGALPDAPLRLAALVLLDRRPDAANEPVVQPVDLGDALTEIVAQTSYLPSLPEPLRTVAEHVASVGGIRRVVYREAESLVPLIPVLVDAATPVPAPREAAVADRRVADLGTGGYARTFADDAIDLDDPERIALLHVDAAGHGIVRVIAGVAPTLWREADGATIEQLTDAAVRAHGEPESGDPRAAVEKAVAELVDAGVLTFTADP